MCLCFLLCAVLPLVCCVSFCVTSALTKDFNVLVGACVCNVLQHIATQCKLEWARKRSCLHHSAACCNMLQHAATHDNLNVIVGTHVYTTLQRTATHCNTLQRIATHCNSLQLTATHCNALQHTATHCNALQHTTTHCNTLTT